METTPTLPPGNRALFARLAVVAGAVVVGLGLQRWLGDYLAGIETLAKTDLLAARAELARVFEVAAVGVFGMTGVVGVSIARACRRSLASGEFPPRGVWSWQSSRRITGPAAKRAAALGIALGVTLVVASAAAGGLLWYMGAILRACRAGVQASGGS